MPNSLKTVARVVIDSNLPQLDREFEYSIPEELRSLIQLGQELVVPFGKAKTPQVGYVVGLEDSAQFAGELGEIAAIRHPDPILFPSTWALLQKLAKRQSCTVAELLRLALPKRAATVDKLSQPVASPGTSASATGRRISQLTRRTATGAGSAVQSALDLVKPRLARGESVLLLTPDDRALQEFSKAFTTAGIVPLHYSSAQTALGKYKTFVRAAREPGQLIIGTRSAGYLPIANLGLVVMWDEGDSSYVEQTSPYLPTRELVLVRQQLEGWDLAFLGNSVSTDIQRLCDIGYLETHEAVGPEAATAISDDVARVDSLAWRAIRQALDSGQPVLVQVSSRGISQSAYCKSCRERIHCAVCKGPVWLNEQGKATCRWCSAPQLATSCAACGNREFVAGRAGATRTVSELGKAFPGARLIEATGASGVTEIEPGKTIVVATPGAEPTVVGGYGAVVLLDGQNLLMRDSLRATEEALRLWSNAAAHAAPAGRVTLTGVSGPIGQAFAVGAIRQAISNELAERRELHFPPAVRMASVVSTRELLARLLAKLEGERDYTALGPLPIDARNMKTALEWRLLIRFPHSRTEDLSALLKQFQLESSTISKAVNTRSGRAMRPVRVRMDEVEVI